MEKNEPINLVLNVKTDYTPKQLRDELNNVFGGKSTGKKFTNQDIYMYTQRGCIPQQYGGQKIKVITSKNIGLKILRLK